MQVTETSAEELKREFTVVVPSADIEDKLNARLTEIGTSVKVPGFRPGKVPLALLKSRYGESVRGEVLQQTVQASYQQALSDKGLRPAMEPDIEIVKFEEGSDLEYKLAVELLPDIEPPNFSEISLERLVVKVGDAEVDSAAQRLAEQHTSYEPVKDDRAAAEGDQVVVDFIGRVDGEEFAGGAVNDFILQLGTGSFLPGFEEQLVGVTGETSREVKVDVADDHPSEKLRGKEVVFDVTVKQVREAQPAAVDDALAQTMGLENVAGLRKSLREEIEKEYAQISRMRLKRSLLDRLADMESFALPAGVVEREFETIWQQVSEAMEKDQLDEDDKGKSEDEMRARYRGIAERRVRLGLLLAEVGRVNNINVSQEDLNRAMHQEAARFPGQEAKVIEYFQNNPAAMQDVQAPIFEDKIVDFIVELATVTDREVPVEELLKDPDETAAADASPEAEPKPADETNQK
jgi:trigger factor